MFRKFVIAVITAVAAILETAADAIAATLPPPAADTPRLRLVASGRLCPRPLIVSPFRKFVIAVITAVAARHWRRGFGAGGFQGCPFRV